jgi:hypothetical protein
MVVYSPAMGATCWRCQAEVKREGAYCPTCGAALRPGEGGGAAGVDWQSRIQGEPKGRRTWAYVVLGVLALLALPFTAALGALTGPAFAARNGRRLRRHVGERLASPAMAGDRFTATREGEEIRRKLEKLARPGALAYAWVVQYLLLIAAGLVLFVGAARAPWFIDYWRALENTFEVRGVSGRVPVGTELEFERWTDGRYVSAHDVRYETVRRLTPGEAATMRLKRSGSSWGPSSDRYGEPPPYEFIHTSYPHGELKQATAVNVRWEGTETYGAIFWTLGGTYLASLAVVHFLYWLKFMRHRTTEVLAAAYARGDVKFHDEVMAKAQSLNHGLMFGAIALSVLQLHVVVFPWMAPLAMRLHERWEQRVGVAPALGVR